jgi:hypothetical protein
MKKSTKAVLLSAFVFPGIGHLLLRKYKSAAVLMSLSFAGLYYLISNAVERALQISEELQSGDVPLDVTAIAELVSKQTTGTEAQLINLATLAVFICWIAGIVDSYRAGRARDRETESENTFH